MISATAYISKGSQHEGLKKEKTFGAKGGVTHLLEFGLRGVVGHCDRL